MSKQEFEESILKLQKNVMQNYLENQQMPQESV